MDQVKQNLNGIENEKNQIEQESKTIEEYKTKIKEKIENFKQKFEEAEEMQNLKLNSIDLQDNDNESFTYQPCPASIREINNYEADRLQNIFGLCKSVKNFNNF